jgi:F0F1-type ATP synthase assembly protein I
LARTADGPRRAHVNLADKREMNRGFSNAFSRSFEIAGLLALFALAGLGLDRWLGSAPLFVIIFSVFAFIGQFVRMYYAYNADMDRQQHVGTRGVGPRRPVEQATP